MTKQKSFKREVRSRMQKTGERYVAARQQLTDRSDRASAPAQAAALETPGSEPALEPQSDEAIIRGTGRGWDEWFAILDEWGATEHTHTEIARWLVSDKGVGSWWSQSVTVGYERARGMRSKHQMATGFSVGATKTVDVSAEELSAAFTDPQLRERWLPGAKLGERTSHPGRSARFDWAADGSVLLVGYTAKTERKAQVAVQHERIADSREAERMKAFWRQRLSVLKGLLEA